MTMMNHYKLLTTMNGPCHYIPTLVGRRYRSILCGLVRQRLQQAPRRWLINLIRSVATPEVVSNQFRSAHPSTAGFNMCQWQWLIGRCWLVRISWRQLG